MTEEERAAAEAAAKAAEEKAAADEAARLEREAEEAKKAALAGGSAAELEQLKADLAAAKQEAEQAKADAAKFKGLDPEKAKADAKKVAESEAAAREAEKKQAEAEGNFAKLRELQNEEFEAKVSAEREAREAAEKRAQEVTDRLDQSNLKSAFASSRFFSDETILTAHKAQLLYGSHVEVDGDEVVVYDRPSGDAKRAKIMDSKGNPLPFDQAIKKVVEADPDKDSLLKSKIKPGGGSKTEDQKPTQSADRMSRLAAGIAALSKK